MESNKETVRKTLDLNKPNLRKRSTILNTQIKTLTISTLQFKNNINMKMTNNNTKHKNPILNTIFIVTIIITI